MGGTGPVVGVGELLWDVLPSGVRTPGGAPLNFAFHCRQLGRDAVVVDRVGADEAGDALRAAVRGLGLADDFIQTDPARPTGTVLVTLDPAGVPGYTITEHVAWDHLEWTPDLAALLHGAAAVGTGTLSRRAGARKAVDAAARACPGVRLTDVNLRQHFHSAETVSEALAGATVAKLTADEMAVISSLIGLPNDEPADLLTRLPELTGVAVTDGANGAAWVGRDGGPARVPGVPVDVVDTVGAGDAFAAALVCGLLAGRPPAAALAEANAYAAEVCRHPGGTPRFAWHPAAGPG